VCRRLPDLHVASARRCGIHHRDKKVDPPSARTFATVDRAHRERLKGPMALAATTDGTSTSFHLPSTSGRPSTPDARRHPTRPSLMRHLAAGRGVVHAAVPGPPPRSRGDQASPSFPRETTRLREGMVGAWSSGRPCRPRDPRAGQGKPRRDRPRRRTHPGLGLTPGGRDFCGGAGIGSALSSRVIPSELERTLAPGLRRPWPRVWRLDKALAVAARVGSGESSSADTIVVIDTLVLGKPAGPDVFRGSCCGGCAGASTR